MDTQTERVDLGGGELRRITFIGKTEKTPEERVIDFQEASSRPVSESQSISKVADASELLDMIKEQIALGEQQKVSDILDYLKIHDSLSDYSGLNEWLSLNRNWRFESEAELSALLQLLMPKLSRL